MFNATPNRSRRRPSHVESLETRRLLTAVAAGNVSGTYSTNVEWTDTSAPYVLTGSLFVAAGSTLTIGSGVRVIRPSGSGATLYVADDNSSAKLNATGAQVAVDVIERANAGGSLTNDTFNAFVTFEGQSTSGIVLTTDTFNGGIQAHGEFVPRLPGNTFAAGTLLNVTGTVDTNTTWPVITNVDHYQLAGSMFVAGGATLTLNSGVRLGRPSGSGATLYVADDNSSAKLAATGVQFDVDLIERVNAGGTLNNDTFTAFVTFEGQSGSALAPSGDTFNGGVQAHGEFVPKLPGNTFPAGSVVNVTGTVDTATTWPVIPNVTRYQLVNSMFVAGGATLTLAPGVRLGRPSGSGATLYVSDDGSSAKLVATGVQFDVELIERVSAGGTLTGDTFTAFVTFEGQSGSALAPSGDTFNGGVQAHGEFVPKLPGNTFAAGTVVNVTGTVDANTTWPVIPNVDRYQLVNTMFVAGGATLTLAGGVRLGRPSGSGAALYVADDNSGASLQATSVQFGIDLLLRNNAGGRLRYCDVNGVLTINGASTALVQENDFSGGSVVAEGSTNLTIDLRNNFWGATATASDIENKVTHKPDAPVNTRPLVLYQPFLSYDPTDVTPPELGGAFDFGANQQVRLVASENVQASFALSDVAVQNLTNNVAVPASQMSFSYNAATNVATVAFSPRLADGNYRLTVLAASVTDAAGNPLAHDLVMDFFVLAGDANRDRSVDIADFAALQNHFNLPGAYADGDFNGDGTVNIADFAMLQNNFNKTLPAPTSRVAAAPAPLSAAPSSSLAQASLASAAAATAAAAKAKAAATAPKTAAATASALVTATATSVKPVAKVAPVARVVATTKVRPAANGKAV